MEMSQGKSLDSYLKQTKMLFFFFLQNWRTGGQNSSCLGVQGGVPVEGEKMWGKDVGG
jgi:hypothetical protein